MPLPPRIVRRVVVDPLALVLCVAFLALSPVALAVAFLVDLASHGRWPTVRLVLLAIAYLALEVVGLASLFALWVASGFGIFVRTTRLQAAHYRFMGLWLHALYTVAVGLLGLRIQFEDTPPPRAGAVLVFSRHAGAGDSIFLASTLMHRFGRRCRIVMKAELQLDPVIDVAGNRCPNAFVRPNSAQGDRFVADIASLATGIGERDALILFPEGGNYTRLRWKAAIQSLRKRGFERDAERAERMRHLLPPRPGGASAAISAAPDADVVFVAHTGLEQLSTVHAIWARIPVVKPIRTRYWRLAPNEVPPAGQERIDWLFSWWETIDRWIDERSPIGESAE